MTNPVATNRIRLEGRFAPLSDDVEGIIEAATFIQRNEGRQELVLRGREKDKTLWEAHLHSQDGRTFLGEMTSKQWDYGYSVEMESWVPPTGGQERLLFGTYQAAGLAPVEWLIHLWPPEDD
jgi:hypothetical protein